jgi:hypothetical protein
VALPGDLRESVEQPGRDQRHLVVDADGHTLAGHAEAGEGQAVLFGPGQRPHQLVVAGRRVDRTQAKEPAKVGKVDAGLAGGRGQLGDVADQGEGRGPDHR